MLTYSRAEWKQAAKNGLQGRWGLAIASYLLAVLVPSMVLGVFSGVFSGGMEAAALGEIWGLYTALLGIDSLFTLAVTFCLLGPLSIGYYFFSLRFVRGMDVTATMPFQAFTAGNYGRFTLSFLMMNLFIFLWSLLFVIPGIIKSFAYAQMPYILMDHPEMGWKEALDESRRMMDGHKGELFVLGLSFIPWLLLVCVTFGIAVIYVGPYMQMTYANFYRALKEERLEVIKGLPGQPQ